MAGKKNQNNVAKVNVKQQESNDFKDYRSLKTVSFYCALIVFLPVFSFFLLKGYLLDSIFTLTEVSKCIYSALGAVSALHIALGLFVYRAYFGGERNKKTD